MRAKHMRKRPQWKRQGPVVVIVALAVLVAAVVWAATRSDSSATPAATASSSTSTSLPLPASTIEATTVSEPSTSLQGSTTVAIGPPVEAPGSLTYTMAAGTTVTVVASNPCWIELRASAGGPTTQVTTLQAGQTLSLSSPLWMRLGNPANVHVTAGTTALQLPNGPGDLVIRSA
jgi:Domain of unknown function (DUF4115)